MKITRITPFLVERSLLVRVYTDQGIVGTGEAGLWAHHAQRQWQFIEPGDVEAAMQTASSIGDDRMQRRSQGYIVPDAFTHGSSEQRVRWFMAGLKSGQLAACDTFQAREP